MAKTKKAEETKEVKKVEEEVKVDDVKISKDILKELAEFKTRMTALEEENKLLNEQVTLRNELGNNPLAYTDVQDKPVAANVLPSYSARLMRAMEEDQQIVEGKFEYKEITRPKEAKGSGVRFFYRKYPGEQVQEYNLTHNQVYRLPLGVAKHINGELGGCKYNIHKHIMDSQGNPVIDAKGEEVHRMGFHSTKFY